MKPKKKKCPHSTSGKKFGKILKIRKDTLENSEKYFQKFGKIQVRPKKKGPHSNLGKKFGKILKIRKNTPKNSEKYWKFLKKTLWKFLKFEKIFWNLKKIFWNFLKLQQKLKKILDWLETVENSQECPKSTYQKVRGIPKLRLE